MKYLFRNCLLNIYEILPRVSTRGGNAPESVASEDRGGDWLDPEFDVKEDLD